MAETEHKEAETLKPCSDCGTDAPCDENCPNYVNHAPRPIEEAYIQVEEWSMQTLLARQYNIDNGLTAESNDRYLRIYETIKKALDAQSLPEPSAPGGDELDEALPGLKAAIEYGKQNIMPGSKYADLLDAAIWLEILHAESARPAEPANVGDVAWLKSEIHILRRQCEMAAGVMRDPKRTGKWEGAERVAQDYDRKAKSAHKIEEYLKSIAPQAPSDAQPTPYRIIEHHGIAQINGPIINEHWMVNGKRFDHEPCQTEIDAAYAPAQTEDR